MLLHCIIYLFFVPILILKKCLKDNANQSVITPLSHDLYHSSKSAEFKENRNSLSCLSVHRSASVRFASDSLGVSGWLRTGFDAIC